MEVTEKISQSEKKSRKTEVKIFVVDDDLAYRQAVELRLRRNPNYRIYSFRTGEECLRHFKFLDPDVVILDYNFSTITSHALNGLEILKKLKTIDSKKPVLMLSGQENHEVATSSVKYGAFDYIVKNENTFIRLGNHMNKILNNKNSEQWGKKQGDYIRIMTGIIPIAIAAPVVSTIFIPGLTPFLIAILFVLSLLFYL